MLGFELVMLRVCLHGREERLRGIDVIYKWTWKIGVGVDWDGWYVYFMSGYELKLIYIFFLLSMWLLGFLIIILLFFWWIDSLLLFARSINYLGGFGLWDSSKLS